MYVCVCVCVCVCMYHIFFSHSSVLGHLGYFHILAIIKNAAVYIGMHASFQMFLFSSDIYPEVELLDHMVVLLLLFFFFEEPPYCVPEWLHQFIFPPTVYWGSLFSAVSPTLIISFLVILAIIMSVR